jgi:[ribosomal protein S18]-alanine N-acetyltransferase
MKITLREYFPADFETLCEIDRECYEPGIAYSRRMMREYLDHPASDCVVAEAGGKIVGFCITVREATAGYIVTMDVLAAHRRRGVGSRILAQTERRLAAAGVQRAALETATDNASAVAFWKKHGYRTRAVKKGYYPGGRDAFAMAKPIARTSPSPEKRG